MTRTTTTIGRQSAVASTGLDRFRDDVLHGLALPRKDLPCKYLYDERGSALFDEICGLDEYYLTRTELGMLERHAGEMAEAIGPDCELIELGSGSAVKTRLLLEQLREPRAYIPVDISHEPLLRSAADLGRLFPALEIIPVCDDFTGTFDLPEAGSPPASRRVVFFPGSTIGNFRPAAAQRLLSSIARLVGPGGGLLIGCDLDKDESIVWPAYNDRRGISAAFNLNLLARINRELEADFDLEAFAHRADYVRDREHVELSLVSRTEQVVCVGGREFSFDAGEPIHTEDSYKYRHDTFARLTRRAGFSVEGEWRDERDYFCVQLLSVD
jgi:dimethylhistidine N-methyltransferase